MEKKQFQTESKKLLDMMINSIYTHKEIFLRELISNASDAIDKLYFRSLTDASVTLQRDDYEIRIAVDKEARTLTLSDNGCGMTLEELENNLGTIAKSGSFDFKKDLASGENREQVDVIGQFGVGFYSAFMVSDEITVVSRAYGAEDAHIWRSAGVDGYTVDVCEKDTPGTEITLHIKPDGEEEKYSEFLEEYTIRQLIKKYSDYIRYPIRMLTTSEVLKEGSTDEYETKTEDETLNSMIPIWKKNASEVTEEEYASFYQEKFYDFEAPLKVIRQKSEGMATYEALLFIPARAPYNYYSREYEKGLQLYSSGVLIMEKCKDLLPDYFSFVRGLVDSADLSLNISREMLQHDRQLKTIAKAIEKKIAGELSKMLESGRESYEKFYAAFGRQLKFGLYSDYGMHKAVLQDLVMFPSSGEQKLTTLKEYVARMRENQKKIYYASGESAEQIALLPRVESVVKRGYEVLYLTEDVDEFAIQVLHTYAEKEFSNVCADKLDIDTEEEKENLREANEKYADILAFMKESLNHAVTDVRLTSDLENHPVCLSSVGNLSFEMEKVLNQMPNAEENQAKAQIVLEINLQHPITNKLAALYEVDRDCLARYARILYAQARLISGLKLENPAEIAELVCELMSE